MSLWQYGRLRRSIYAVIPQFMDADAIFSTFNLHKVRYILIGGMNFMLRHQPILTFDVDLWIEDTPENRDRCAVALQALNAEWGPSIEDWKSVEFLPDGWLDYQAVFSLLTSAGAVDIFRAVKGMERWEAAWQRSESSATANGTPFHALCDEDLLACQLALPITEQKQDRIAILKAALLKKDSAP